MSPTNHLSQSFSFTLKEAADITTGSRGLHSITPFTYAFADYPTRPIQRYNLPALRFTDGPKGVNLGKSTCFPVALARGASWDSTLEYKIGQTLALEAAAQGANALGSTCINLIRHGGWGRAQESFGSDPIHVGQMGVALMTGIQSKGVLAVVKHFACNSMENSRFKVNVKIDNRALHEMYLPHFKQCVDAGIAGVMSAYNRVNGDYCGHNAYLLKTVLKQRWQFNGFVMSDFVLGVRSCDALAQGIDMEMPQRFWFSPLLLKRAIAKGTLTTERLMDAATRVAQQIQRFNLTIEQPHPKVEPALIACSEHQQLALESALKSCVLLKNENQTLPIAASSRIAVIGTLAQQPNLGSAGSTTVNPPFSISLIDGLKQTYPDQHISYDSGKNIAAAVELAKTADFVVIAAGLKGSDEGEYFPLLSGGDRAALELSDHQIKLIEALSAATTKHTVVLYGGSSIACGAWAQSVQSMLMAWYPGMMGGLAVAQLLAGKVNPSGHLPLSFPTATNRYLAFNPSDTEVVYDRYHDYRWFNQQKIEPAFAFGHGLSYSQFSLEQMQVETKSQSGNKLAISVQLTVKNDGDYEGATVVQLYLAKPFDAAVDHPELELKAFERVELKTGEKKTLSFELTEQHLAWFNAESDLWTVSAGDYQIMAGFSCKALTADVQVNVLEAFEFN